LALDLALFLNLPVEEAQSAIRTTRVADSHGIPGDIRATLPLMVSRGSTGLSLALASIKSQRQEASTFLSITA
jgi:hypothetical protein